MGSFTRQRSNFNIYLGHLLLVLEQSQFCREWMMHMPSSPVLLCMKQLLLMYYKNNFKF